MIPQVIGELIADVIKFALILAWRRLVKFYRSYRAYRRWKLVNDHPLFTV